MVTRFGPTILLTLRENGYRTTKIYLQKRDSTIWTQHDIESVTGRREKYYLINRGKYENFGIGKGVLILAIEN
jgi:hypothetical protein